MTDHDDARITLHEDVPLFREAIAFTAAKTGFSQQVIEKDYFCTVLLEDLTNHGGPGLVFKGGTCLAKVHAGFYRLSEDLDFSIQIRNAASRSERGNAARGASILGRLEDAGRDFLAAAAADNTRIEAAGHAVDFFLRQGKSKEAESMLHRLLDDAPGRPAPAQVTAWVTGRLATLRSEDPGGVTARP